MTNLRTFRHEETEVTIVFSTLENILLHIISIVTSL